MKFRITLIAIALLLGSVSTPSLAQQENLSLEVIEKKVASGEASAIALVIRKANEGDSDYQNFLGLMYADGIGVQQSDVNAAKWFQLSAKQGNVLAYNSLGNMYALGQGVPQDYTEAVKWYTHAANYSDAEISLGNMYATGRGVPKNLSEALKHYRVAVERNSSEAATLTIKLAEQGDVDAQEYVGDLYGSGQHLEQNAIKALAWYRKAAEQGSAGAQLKVAAMLYSEAKTQQDYADLASWLWKAAEQGNDAAIFAFADLYRSGRVEPRSDLELVKYLRRLAGKGNFMAQTQLADMYEKGQGVAKNEAEAAHWRGMLAEEERHENMLIQSTKRSVEFGIVAPIEASHWPVKAGTFSLLAGNIDGPGSADGIGLNAQFSDGSCEGMGAIQKGIASDKDGNIYLADEGNDTIRKLSPSGTVSTVAGKAGYAGSTDGIGSEARFNCPTSVAIDGEGNLFVTDSANFTIRKITPSGQVSTIAGQAGEHGLVDGKGAAARFHRTKGIAIGADGTLYVADTFNASIRKISPDGVVTTLAGGLKGGYADGKGTAASFNNPTDVALDDLDNVYVVDQMNDAIRKISPAGVVTTFLASDASSITVAGNTFATTLNGMLSGVGVDKSGNVYVSTLREIYKVSADGKLSTLAGSKYRGTSDGQGVSASFSNPGHVAVSPSGDVVVADEYSIRSIKSEGIVTTLAGRARQGGSKDGAGVDAQFDQPQGIVADRQGNVYVSDTGNAVIRKITPLGLVTTYAGTLKRHALKDAKGTAAEMNYVNQLAIDGNANLYFTDAINHVVRKIDAHGDVTTFAGTAGLSGNVDGMGSQARFKRPVAITADPKGNLYVYDFDSDAIRKIDSHGTVTTVKGISLKDMGQDDASVQLSADGLGNIYVTVSKSIYSVIRKVDRHGVVTTLVGVTDTYGIPSDLNGMPRKTLPRAHVSDAVGNVYFFDSLYSTIRKAAPDGSITTIAGTPGTYGITLGSPGSVNGVSGMAILDSKTLVLTSGNAILKLSIP